MALRVISLRVILQGDLDGGALKLRLDGVLPSVAHGSHGGVASCRLTARVVSSNSFVLGIALLLGVVVPELIHSHISGTSFDAIASSAIVEPSFIATAVAIIAAHMLFRQIGTLPLVSTRLAIIPTFLSTFGVLGIILYSSHIPYGRFHLLTGMGFSIAWYYVVSVLRGRTLRPTIGLLGLPGTFAGQLPGGIRWVVLEEDELPGPVDAVVVDPHASLSVRHARFITDLVLAGIPVYHRGHIEEGLTGKVVFQRHADNNFGALLPSSGYLRVKRLFDLIASMLLILPAALVVGVAAIGIKLDDGGPVFYNAERMGFRGRRFTCYKLRTMTNGRDGAAYTLEHDPRITRIGAYLRKWRIDEVPQILNVIKGDMSWIGPRPEATALAEKYAANIAFYDYRHAVRPGITGWAAVHQGNVGDIDAAREKLKFDFYYIKYFSIWLDILIALKTIQTILSGFGSR